jgi:tetratricopeptide (TPR) repeat protein
MLATNLARVPELHVLSTARMYELLSENAASRDTGSAATVVAARRAGASRLVDGALFQLADGLLRLDLRLVDLSNGNVVVARSVTGTDPFALVDSATALLVAEAGGVAPAGSIADVSTRSMVAYRLYEEGLRAFYQNDRRSAQQFFDAAFAEDTTFAMAAYYAALTRRDNIRETMVRFERALRLVGRTSDRERLIILAHWALLTYSPALGALADTLSVRYPQEVEGHLFSGAALFKLARYAEAIAALERAVAMDSASLAGGSARCSACDALEYLVRTHRAADDYTGAERVARRWIRLQPRSAQAWEQLHAVLGILGRTDEALEALRRRVSVAPSVVAREPVIAAQLRLVAGDYAAAERMLNAYVASTVDTARLADATWYLIILYRHEGRLREALDAARRFRALMTPVRDTAPELWGAEAQVRLESGEHRRGAAMFDTIAAFEGRARLTPNRARSRVWRMAQIATALAAAGDTAPLAALADTMRALGAGSGEARDQRLHHYVRGLVLAARGRDDDAAAELALAHLERHA